MGANFSTHVRTLSLTLSVVLAMGIRIPALGYAPSLKIPQSVGGSDVLIAGLPFRLPNIRASRNHTAGASRGQCISENQLAMAKPLLPSTDVGLTVAANPTFFVNLPSTSAKSVEFTLQDQAGNEVYKTTLAPPSAPGVVSLTLSQANASSPALAVGKRYEWELALICDPGDSEYNIHLYGEIERRELSPTLANQLEKTAPRDRLAIYAENGLWYDTITTLAQLRQTNPNDSQLTAEWTSLLQDFGGLDANIAQAPLVGSLTKMKN